MDVDVRMLDEKIKSKPTRCVLDEEIKSKPTQSSSITCINWFEVLVDEECRFDECYSEVNINLEAVSSKVGDLEDKREKRLRVATWYRKCKEVGEC